jgi:DNA-binding GntR family transcriptional regulator
VKRLRTEATRLRALVDRRQFVECMIALADFHRVLAELAGNRTLLFTTRLLQTLVASHQVNFFTEHKLSADEQQRRLTLGISSFHKLIDLIEAGNADGAEAHWRLHIANANASWVPPEDEGKMLDALD